MAITATDVHAHVRDELVRRRQRYTSGRRDLVGLLVEIGRPATIRDLVEAGASPAQSSLYRNLAVLEQCEVVRRITTTDEVTHYELAEELTEHHHHVVCNACGRIDDVVLPAEVEEALVAATAAARDQQDYEVQAHRVELVGTCGPCRG